MTKPLKLNLTHGSFVVLAADNIVQTCVTDYSGTSRSSYCSAADLVQFAKAVLEQIGQTPTS
jgi:hypothetical protein